MQSMFERAFGKNAAPGEVSQAPPKQMSMQERAIESLMKTVLPGFDISTLENIGNEVQAGVLYFKNAIDRIEARQRLIMKRLEIEDISNAPDD